MYINGVQQTLTTSTAIANVDHMVNATNTHSIGRYFGAGSHFDGYMTEVNFIDGQALDPTSFGEYNEDTGVWQPIKYVGTYGTNGFYLNFSDNSTTTTLGYDTSGNSNNWTANNISVTSGVTYDSMTDVPTLTSEDAANYATLNPLMLAGTGIDVAQGNLYANRNSADWARIAGSIGVTSGKWYWEITPTNNTTLQVIGIGLGNTPSNYPGYDSNTYGFYTGNGLKYNNATGTTYGSYSAGQIVGVALDLDNGKIWFSCNGTWQASGDPAAGTNAAFTSVSGTYFPEYGVNSISTNGHANFGQRPFAYTPPTGFKSLNTYNLPDSTIVDGSQYFDVRTWSGDSVTPKAVVTDLGFQPDLIWAKTRSTTYDHMLFDSVRGAGSTKDLSSNTTSAEGTSGALYGYVSSIDSAGFTVTKGSQATNVLNQSGQTFVAWNWKANGSGASNTDGSITSTVSANTTAGFSIVTYTGNGGTDVPVGHGLGSVPKMLIVKNRDTANDWYFYTTVIDGSLDFARLNTTAAFAASSASLPTSSVFYVTGTVVNNSGDDVVAYCFADVEGYSKFGSYTGNGSADGSFVYTGFRPAFVLIKQTSTSGASWTIHDSTRNTYNLTNNVLYPNLSNAETSPSTQIVMDLLSNGFKLKGNAANVNASGATYIYMALAENPFKNALAR